MDTADEWECPHVPDSSFFYRPLVNRERLLVCFFMHSKGQVQWPQVATWGILIRH